ncbi:hypothetical protein PPERSA_11819 [Pseudocohnilembus persalinus]|uniref:Galactose oxidase/kelch, beta-propeller n=1 Tax=Pseudocohnilembus persalinus TaxID=266149 RepID=A0A0V0QR72_PSEPJ|nr:hypothetical protein PPERSA_11819 [Pseudocohnilembus persalinus]|eukprot:KRX04763.1 hypothetical protein PPERSA_11819 [Pseudocohnilembus persalinus]
MKQMRNLSNIQLILYKVQFLLIKIWEYQQLVVLVPKIYIKVVTTYIQLIQITQQIKQLLQQIYKFRIKLNFIINIFLINLYNYFQIQARKSQQFKLLKARQQHKVLRVDNKIIVVGGGYTENQEDFQYIPECEMIDLEKKQVQYLPPLNYPRLNCSLAQNQNKQIFCFGGYLKNETNCPYIEYLNLQNPTQWMVLQDPNYTPFSDSLIVDIRDNQFIIFGGTQKS